MKMQMFAKSEKVKPDRENVGSLSLAAVKRTTVEVTKPPLWHELHGLGHDLQCKA
jgi:hypothetical protein